MTKDKFILMGMDEAGDIADVLKSKTSKKILDYLAECREASEKDIADGLGMALNTIEYNLKKLIGSGLVKKTSNFFWSVKGKKIPTYKLARKHIVISPGKKPDLSVLKSILPVVLIAAILVALAGMFMFPGGGVVREDSDSGLKQFSSLNELKEFLSESSDGGEINVFGGGEIMAESSVDNGVVTAGSQKSSADSGTSDHSTTNIQVEGVDEADIVKNDGKYIYVVSGGKVVILDAYPAEDMEVLSEINFSGSINQIYINDDKLIVFGNKYGIYPVHKIDGEAGSLEIAVEGAPVECLGSRCGGRTYQSIVYIYDIADRENPKLENEFSSDSNYVNSRMIGDYVYVVYNKYVNARDPVLPVYWEDGVERAVMAEDVYYFDYRNNYVFTTIVALNVEDGNVEKKVYLTDGSSNVYVSQDNIYLTSMKQMDYRDYLEGYVDDVALSILPSDKGDGVFEVLDSEDPVYRKLSKIRNIVYDYSYGLEGDEKEEFDSKLMALEEEFEILISKKYEKTVVHKISVDKSRISYQGNGEVPGRVLNQFSMDEHDGYFRIAVTTGNTWRDTSLNHVYVLDGDLDVVGSVEDLAKGERIYSARFMGDRVYMVTFKQVDPLFVIDLSDVEAPEVLGYLKVTGYSSYLHPYDENHIIGIGMEADESGRVRGVKVALFDVSDVSDPREISKYELGAEWSEKWSWSHSEALHDHKAFLFDKEKEILVIPMSYTRYLGGGGDWKNREYWQGAYVFDINLEDGIGLRGRVSHFEGNDSRWNHNIRRSLYMDDVLYTISNLKVKASDLLDLSDVSEVVIGEGYEVPVYYAREGVDVVGVEGVME